MKSLLVRLLVAFELTLLACAATPAADLPVRASMEYGGRVRTYELFVPPSGSSTPRPLVVVLHGHFGTGDVAMRRYHIVESAARYGAIAVAPDGVARGWNDGRAASAPAFAEQRSVDDIGFIAALIAQLRSRYSIDPTRVYAIGMSNGGIFAQYLACKRADLFAGIGSVASSMAKEIACAPSRGLSVAIVDGTADPVVPFAGGAVGLTTKDRGSVIGAPRTIAFWARADRCRESPMQTSLTHRASNDLTSATVARYVRCSGNTAVTFVTIEGGGHTWPGERGRSIPALGATSHDLDATDFLFETLLR